MSAVKKQLVVFDFDWSFVDQDTDRWVPEVLAPDLRRKMEDLRNDVQWTDLVTQTMEGLHARGISREQIEDTLKAIPFHPAMKRAVTNLKASSGSETTFFCLSNANAVFIPTILKSKGLDTLFEKIVTNPAEWDPSGLLRVRRRVDPNGPQHQCSVGCSPNMCKGDELEAFLANHATKFDRVVYVGDGSNDFCPIVRLRSQDLAVARTFGGLANRIAKEGEKEALKCEVKYWTGAWEVEEIFSQL
ncbi:hypothetical protein PLICRDRAFT_51170 [Plicaturopsis crispa FD-325 SS-3]|nr:hypothetical protein PLICRDRAFT_51170 [Plicaturopsis crispa FD-325 SS-3]